MKIYKILFWITLVFLFLTNLFWIHNKMDTAVGHSYYKDSCEAYKNDLTELQKLLSEGLNKTEMLNYLDSNKIVYNAFEKGNEYIIQFTSFDLVYDNTGNLIK
ncbi:MAG: hypothetical protein H6553_11350 [Chitinophagales bacterium]|nr:hypothetical protein [Chitinophagales bacterium]